MQKTQWWEVNLCHNIQLNNQTTLYSAFSTGLRQASEGGARDLPPVQPDSELKIMCLTLLKTQEIMLHYCKNKLSSLYRLAYNAKTDRHSEDNHDWTEVAHN